MVRAEATFAAASTTASVVRVAYGLFADAVTVLLTFYLYVLFESAVIGAASQL